ncbi:S1C family serine protease [Chloroflexota bacterium]
MKSLKSTIVAVLAVLIIAGAVFTVVTGVTFTPNTASASTILYSEDTVTEIYDSASPAVVEIQVSQQGTSFYGRYVQEGLVSGFLIDDQGHILNNNHVVEGATSLEVVFQNGDTAQASVVGTDPLDDLAVIKVASSEVSGIAPLQLGHSDMVKPGQMAIALSSPFGFNGTITVGVISGLNRSLSGSSLTQMMQTDAAINPGNSGGPLLDARGNVIGINTAVEATITGAKGIGFAVPSNVAIATLPSLKEGKSIIRPWLGITGGSLTPTLSQQLGISANKGVYVLNTASDGPAEKAGLKGGGTDASGNPEAGGDVITAVDGKVVSQISDLSNYFKTKNVGDRVTLSVLRDDSLLEILIILEAWPNQILDNTKTETQPQPSFQFPWSLPNHVPSD